MDKGRLKGSEAEDQEREKKGNKAYDVSLTLFKVVCQQM